MDLLAKGIVKIDFEEGNRLLPKATIDSAYLQDLCTPWKDALVIKLLGKTIGYNVLKERVKKLWKLNGGFDLLDVDNG